MSLHEYILLSSVYAVHTVHSRSQHPFSRGIRFSNFEYQCGWEQSRTKDRSTLVATARAVGEFKTGKFQILLIGTIDVPRRPLVVSSLRTNHAAADRVDTIPDSELVETS
jgi:hypothetical protein